MSSFFTLPTSQRKRKRTEERPARPSKRRGVAADDGVNTTGGSTRQRTRTERDDSVSGSESDSSIATDEGSRSASSEEEEETAGDRRLRLAQRYLDNIREEVDEAGFDAADVDKDLIAQRLREDVDEAKGRQYRLIASSLDFENATPCQFRADTQSTTAVAVCAPYAYTVSKDKTIIKWEIQSPDPHTSPLTNGFSRKPPPSRRKKPRQLAFVRGIKVNASSSNGQHGHTDSILSLAVSPNNQYIATGGADKKLIIWSAATLAPLKTFTTHRDSVTSLTFAPATRSSIQPGASSASQLFSSSADRTLKTYSLTPTGDSDSHSLAYVETLFGHQDHVLSLSSPSPDTCISVGARDRTARLWKCIDETQLVFRGDTSKHDPYKTGSLDVVAVLPPQHFVTGSDSGALQLWSIHKKKPLDTVLTAHGVEDPEPLEAITSERDKAVVERLKLADKRRPTPRHITALATVPGTDVILSGSWDGHIRAWKLPDDKRTLIRLGHIGCTSPSLQVSPQQQPNGTSPPVPTPPSQTPPAPGPIRGVINSLAVFERRRKTVDEYGGTTREGECLGLCVVAGTGKEMRLGRWRKFLGGRNGAVVVEVGVKGKEREEGVEEGGTGERVEGEWGEA